MLYVQKSLFYLLTVIAMLLSSCQNNVNENCIDEIIDCHLCENDYMILGVFDYTIELSDSTHLRILIGESIDEIRTIGSLLESYPFIEFIEVNYLYHSRHIPVVINFSFDVEDFRFIEIYYMVDENQNHHFVGETLFSIDKLKANQPFVVSWLHQWHEPDRGILFIDVCGNPRVFTLTENSIGGEASPWRIFELNEFGVLYWINY